MIGFLRCPTLPLVVLLLLLSMLSWSVKAFSIVEPCYGRRHRQRHLSLAKTAGTPCFAFMTGSSTCLRAAAAAASSQDEGGEGGEPTTASASQQQQQQQHQQQTSEESSSSSETGQGAATENNDETAPAPAATTDDNSSTDILNSPAFLKRKLDVIKNDIAAVEDELATAEEQLRAGKAEWGPQIDDLQKEYRNMQDRMNAQGKQRDSAATVDVVRKMLEVLDNYDRAFGAVTAQTDQERAIEAEYRSTYDMILETFTTLGVEVIDTVGCEFDYEVHQAVMQRPVDDYEEGIVCEELQKGFKLGDSLVRAAMVVVAA